MHKPMQMIPIVALIRVLVKVVPYIATQVIVNDLFVRIFWVLIVIGLGKV